MELIINAVPDGVDIALIENKKLVELHKEKTNKRFAVGDIYLGKTQKVIPSLNAAFVDVGYEKDAFLHYLDLGPQFSSLTKFTKKTITGKQHSPMLGSFKMEEDIDKEGKITDVLSSKQHIVVQVAKEPISSKGPRLSSEVTLAGRFIVLVPFSNKISVSQKIKEAKERDRLRRLLTSIKPNNFGVIIRTVAENKKVAELDQDLKNLISKWKQMHRQLKTATPPKMLLGELNRSFSILRDLLTPDFTSVHVNDEAYYQELNTYIKTIAPGREKILKLYKGKKDIFEHFGIQKQIKASFGRQVSMQSGAYLIVEHTEAMHVIDVNSGNRKSPDKDQEQNALEVNLESADEIARILKLRDMGGIIAIDFIDMTNRQNNSKLFNHLKDVLKSDRAKHTILPPSKFGVVEITRQRVRPETDIKTAETCPTCDGTGEVQATILLIDEIENNLTNILKSKKEKSITLAVHPFVASHLKKGAYSTQLKWFFEHKKWISIKGSTSYNLLDYKFLNKKNEAILS